MPTRRQLLRSGGMVGLIALGAGCARPPDFGNGTGEPPATEPGATTGAPETTEMEETTEATETATETTEAPETTTPEGEVVDVVAGPPNNTLRFEPDSVEIAVGDTVRWTFESAGHNVTSLPGASEKVQNPEDAEPFASYEGNQHYAIVEVGSTFEHTFTVPGEYTYVCAPHEDQGMVGSITVTEQ